MNIYLDVFLTFSKIGAFTLGGGYAMLPLIEREVVDNKHWLQKEEFLDVIAVAQSLPGVMAVNTSIFIGYRLKGVLGSVVSLLATVLPSFVIILLIAMYFTHFKDNAVVAAILKGIRPAVVALIAVPVFTTAKSAGITWKTVVIPIIAAILIGLLGVSPIWIVLAAGLGGFIYGKFTGNTKQTEK